MGGAIGSVLRFLVSKWIQNLTGSSLPWGTLLVNVLGCVLIGVFYGLSEKWGIGGELKLLLTVGFCGGFTTFSTFMNENLSFFQSEHFLYAVFYTGGSVVLGFLGVYAGKCLAGS